MTQKIAKFGNSEEWEIFQIRHPKLTQKLPALLQSLHNVFIRDVKISDPSDRVVFFFGRLCVEDFMEIILLCGNGYGIGAMRLLRGMYERAVTLGYIDKNPDKADQFLEYHHIHRGKHFNHANQIFQMNKHLKPEEIDEIKKSYKGAIEKFKEVLCKKCGTTKTMFSWSKLDLVSMARVAGLEKLYLKCYYEPTLQAHATATSLISRLKVRENGQISFDEGAQREKADSVLIGAHHLMLYILQVENDHFGMGLYDELQDCLADFMQIWKRNGTMENLNTP